MQENDHLQNTFLTLFESGKLASSWLISGEKCFRRDVTNQICLKILSSATNNHHMAPDFVKKHINNGSYGNLFTLSKTDDQNEIPVDAVAPVQDFLRKRPLVEGARIVIIDSIDDLNRFGVNALLKILEEPPVNSFVFLLTSNVSQVLPTIRSRCQILSLDDSQRIDPTLDPLYKVSQNLFQAIKKSEFKNLKTICESAVLGDKSKYDELAQTFFNTVYDDIIINKNVHLADFWLESTSFWQNAKITHLDPQNAFLTLLLGFHQPKLVK